MNSMLLCLIWQPIAQTYGHRCIGIVFPYQSVFSCNFLVQIILQNSGNRWVVLCGKFDPLSDKNMCDLDSQWLINNLGICRKVFFGTQGKLIGLIFMCLGASNRQLFSFTWSHHLLRRLSLFDLIIGSGRCLNYFICVKYWASVNLVVAMYFLTLYRWMIGMVVGSISWYHL